jgi:hypothetical protein
MQGFFRIDVVYGQFATSIDTREIPLTGIQFVLLSFLVLIV